MHLWTWAQDTQDWGSLQNVKRCVSWILLYQVPSEYTILYHIIIIIIIIIIRIRYINISSTLFSYLFEQKVN